MPFSSRALRKLLESEVPSDLSKYLPSGWQQIGSVVILRLHPKLGVYKKRIGDLLLENIPSCKSVLNHTGPAVGQYRIPTVEHISGIEKTETTFTENRCKFLIDPSKVMFSPGNKRERVRLSSLISPVDSVLDMFAGVGQFTVPIGVHAKPIHIEAIEKNSIAFGYLEKNVQQNPIASSIDLKMGDCRKLASKNRVSVVIMGVLPMSFIDFLPTAINAIDQLGLIYCHYTAGKTQAHHELAVGLEQVHHPSITLTPLDITKIKKINQHVHHFSATIHVRKHNPSSILH